MSGKYRRSPPPRLGQKAFALQGGLDVVTPAPLLLPGYAIAMLNYECAQNGYRRIDGYEGFDGHPRPYQASYWILNFDAGTAAIASGETVTGGTSAASGVALQTAVVSSGSYGGSDAAGYLVLTAVSGTFQDNEALKVGLSTKSTANGTATERGASNDADDDTFIRDAIETARAAIAAVPGGGDLRGIHFYNGTAYAFRDDAAVSPTICRMYKSTSTGWSLFSFAKKIAFTSGGTYQVVEGNTITGATSAATALVKRVNITSGTWGGGDAAGWLTINTQVGTFQAENLNVGANLNVATVAGNSSDITLAPGGRYEFRNFNFYGASDYFRMYGCDGVNPAFEFDGTTFAPIRTGMATDAPDHIAVYKNHLFLSFPGGSLQNSGTGDPMTWSAVLGAAEIGIGDDVTGLVEAVGATLTVLARKRTAILYGDDLSNFTLQPWSEGAGAIEWTAAYVEYPIFLDEGGIRDLRATQVYGDFKIGTLSLLVDPILQSKRAAGTTAVASVVSHNKSSYRIFFSDGSGIALYLGGKTPLPSAFNLGIAPTCVSHSEETTGEEILLFGAANGFVYQLDAGNSLNGTEMTHYVRLAFCHAGSPQIVKRWKTAIADIEASETTTLQGSAEFDYGDDNQPSSPAADFTIYGGGAFWDEAQWNEFEWSSPVKGTARIDIDGIGANMSLCIAGTSTYEAPHTLQTLSLLYSLQGLVK